MPETALVGTPGQRVDADAKSYLEELDATSRHLGQEFGETLKARREIYATHPLPLALVAVSEELAFRRVAFSVLRRWGLGDSNIVLASATTFAMVHLTSGPANAVSAFIAGIVIGIVYCITRRLSVCIVLHDLDDFLVFGHAAVAARLFGAG